MVLKIRPQSDSVFIIWNQWVLTRQNGEPTTVYINPTNPKFNIAISYQGSRPHYLTISRGTGLGVLFRHVSCFFKGATCF
jgi:hypothetical protein